MHDASHCSTDWQRRWLDTQSFEFIRLAYAKGAKILIADLQLGEEAKKLVESKIDVHFTPCDVRNWTDLRGLIAVSVSIWNDVPDIYIAGAGVFEPVRLVTDKKEICWNIIPQFCYPLCEMISFLDGIHCPVMLV